MFVVGLFVRPGGTTGLIALAGGGALLLFIGVASLSATIASPVTRMIGWPVEKLLKVPGALARQNVARAPRRTASSASALMIGVALVSSTAVFASSLRSSLLGTIENAVSADFVITDPSFQGSRRSSPRHSPTSPRSAPCRRCAVSAGRSTATPAASARSSRWRSNSSSTRI